MLRELERGDGGRERGLGVGRVWERRGGLFEAAGFDHLFEFGEDAVAIFVGDFVVEGFDDSGDELEDFFAGEEGWRARGEVLRVFAFEEPCGCAPVAFFFGGGADVV